MSKQQMNVDMIHRTVERVAERARLLDAAMLNVEELTAQDALLQLVSLRASIASLRRSEAALEAWLVEIFKDQNWKDPVIFDGIGQAELKWSKGRRAWDHQALAKDWFGRWMESRGGEMPTPHEVVEALLAAAGLSYWRVTQLRPLGIDPDEYCETSDWQGRIVITG